MFININGNRYRNGSSRGTQILDEIETESYKKRRPAKVRRKRKHSTIPIPVMIKALLAIDPEDDTYKRLLFHYDTNNFSDADFSCLYIHYIKYVMGKETKKKESVDPSVAITVSIKDNKAQELPQTTTCINDDPKTNSDEPTDTGVQLLLFN